jgi:hypothetical protein
MLIQPSHSPDGGLLPPSPLWKACSSKIKIKKNLKITYIFQGNSLSLETVFKCFVKKSHFRQVIHGYLGPIQNLGASIYVATVR